MKILKDVADWFRHTFTGKFFLVIMVLGMGYLGGGLLSGVVENFLLKDSESEAGSVVSTSDSEKIEEPGQRKIEEKLNSKDFYYDFSNTKLAWYIVRNEKHTGSGCDSTVNISEYDGFYLDTEPDGKVMYLTFDCGYENGYTEQILDVLKKYQVPACFFVTQTYIRDNEEIVRRMKAEGHLVGNHTVTHPSMPEISYEEILEEVRGTADYMEEKIGIPMDPYLRPPKGEYSCRTLKLTQDLGYNTIFWSIVYLDFDVKNQPGKDYVIEHFNKYCHPGAIILMHNVSSSNAEALETVINNMEKQGYSFASLEDLK